MQTPTVGDLVLVLVHPDQNAGSDVAPGRITHINDDDTINVRADVHAHDYPVRMTVPLFDDRPTADAALDTHRALLPAPSKDQNPWEPHDVYRWQSAAFYPDRAADEQPVDEQPVKRSSPRRGTRAGAR